MMNKQWGNPENLETDYQRSRRFGEAVELLVKAISYEDWRVTMAGDKAKRKAMPAS